jgi:hypothetical protein
MIDNVAYWDYLKQFEYRLTVKLGASHTKEFKEFNEWCQEHLGTKFKDWFITSSSRGVYTLYARSSKWASFLALTYVDKKP